MVQLTGGTSARQEEEEEEPVRAFLRKSRRPGTGAVTYGQTWGSIVREWVTEGADAAFGITHAGIRYCQR